MEVLKMWFSRAFRIVFDVWDICQALLDLPSTYARKVLWHVHPLLGADREIGDCTMAVARQPPANNQRDGVFCAVRKATVWYNNNWLRQQTRTQQWYAYRENVFSTRTVLRCCNQDKSRYSPCAGGVEYLHRSPESRRRRQKGKSRIWDSKIWSQVPEDSDPRMTAVATASSYCKRQTRPLVREGAPHQQTHNCLTVIKIRS
jgi:hypothetical protein